MATSKRFYCVKCSATRPPAYFANRDDSVCVDCAVQVEKEGLTNAPVDEPFVPPVGPRTLHPDTEKELAMRVLARRRLLPFIKRFKPKYDAGWVHKDICRRLERFVKAVENKEEPRLLLMMPVRHGKSEIGSRHFAPWVLGHHPDWEIIAASAAQSLALSFSRYIRSLIRDPAYTALFPQTELDPKSQALEDWMTTAGGGYFAAGIGTMITGRGAHILMLDDPVKDGEAADSATIREATWEWYMSTASTRLAPGGGILGIMTWWHDDDWAGRIQQVMGTGTGDKFEIVKYPAVNDVGDEYLMPDDSIQQIIPTAPVPDGAVLTRKKDTALHPERYTLDSLLRRKANYFALGQQRWWNALYQQNPAPEEGAYFRKDWLHHYAGLPPRSELHVYQAWDFAITERNTSDWTVGVTVAQDTADNLYLMDVLRFRESDGVDLMTTVIRYSQEYAADVIAVEDGQIWKALATTFTRRCNELRHYPSYHVLTPLTDKLVRAQPLRGRMQGGKVFINKDAPWFAEFQQEVLRFPTGKHDDQIDALAWAVRMTLLKSAPQAPAKKATVSWRDKLDYGTSSTTSHMAA